jgi:hypothetical protein
MWRTSSVAGQLSASQTGLCYVMLVISFNSPESSYACTVRLNNVLCAVVQSNENTRFYYLRGLFGDGSFFRTLLTSYVFPSVCLLVVLSCVPSITPS